MYLRLSLRDTKVKWAGSRPKMERMGFNKQKMGQRELFVCCFVLKCNEMSKPAPRVHNKSRVKQWRCWTCPQVAESWDCWRIEGALETSPFTITWEPDLNEPGERGRGIMLVAPAVVSRRLWAFTSPRGGDPYWQLTDFGLKQRWLGGHFDKHPSLPPLLQSRSSATLGCWL